MSGLWLKHSTRSTRKRIIIWQQKLNLWPYQWPRKMEVKRRQPVLFFSIFYMIYQMKLINELFQSNSSQQRLKSCQNSSLKM
jgi:hypothetical protein